MAGTQLMELAGDQFFSRSVCSCNEDARIRRCNRANQFDNGPNFSRIPHDGRGTLHLNLSGQALGLFLQLTLVQCMPHGQQNPVQVQWLLDEVKGAHFDGLDSGFYRTMATDHDYAAVDSFFHQCIKHFQPIHLRHLDVTENGIEGKLGCQLQPFRSVLGLHDLVILVFEDFP